MSRRTLLMGASSLVVLHCSTGLDWSAKAQDVAAPQPFDFDRLTEEMRVLSLSPAQPVVTAKGFFSEFTYDDYKSVEFDAAKARWADRGAAFTLHAFHLGWLYHEPVSLFEVTDGVVAPIVFSADDFVYFDRIRDRVPLDQPLPGVAGFRLNGPLNRLDLFDEVVSFLGASYFRAVGRDNHYGLSARGLAINTGVGEPEEFPRFSRFWIERPKPFAQQVVVCAALESESCTGAYRFVIRPGETTEMDVTARLFFRTEGAQIGVAPLTSMFLFSDKNRAEFDDFRPNVHDSDGLVIHRRDGDHIWRPLNNPARLAESWFAETSPLAFGLMQRDRDFESYQDAVSHYERRPSLLVEPMGDWGNGAVRLVEIPTRLEVNDNIVAFWVPDATPVPGELLEFSYRLYWGALAPDAADDLAHVKETRAGVGGVSGVENTEGTRKFVVDFAGGMLASLPPFAEIGPVVNITGGTITVQTLSKIEDHDIWRLVIDVLPDSKTTVELAGHVAGFGRKLSETWLYQWVIT